MKEVTPRRWTAVEHDTWRALHVRLEHCRQHQAHPLFALGVERLGITGSMIPPLAAVNARLKELTGWSGVAVAGLEDALSFFEGLAERRFPIGNFMREPKDLSYTPAPDVFHDLYGHLPLLADRDYANFCEDIGRRARKYRNEPARLRQFERLFWFGVEFSLIETPAGRRIFGGGILSSFAESNYALSAAPELMPFDVELIRMLDYDIDHLQTKLFVLSAPEQLYSCLDRLEAGLSA